MNNLDKSYQELLKNILRNGYKKEDRTGTGTYSIFGCQIRHNMSEGFPILTTKKVAWNQVVSELLWFLKGSTSLRDLIKDKNYIWVGDAYKRFQTIREREIELNRIMEFSPVFQNFTKKEFINKILKSDYFNKEFGNLGPIYGKQWRSWNGIDQIKEVIKSLKNNPDSRRIMVNAWNVSDLDKMILPPCHYGFQFYTREMNLNERIEESIKLDKTLSRRQLELNHKDLDSLNMPIRKISLMWNQRSVDTPLGLPFNISSYGLLLSIIAKEVNMIPEELIGNLADTHIYLNQIEGVQEQIKRKSFELPIIEISSKTINDISEYSLEDFNLINYKHGPKIEFPLSN